MALSSVTDALAQYNANLDWHTSQSKAESALEAVRYLTVNRAQRLDDQGSSLNFESLAVEKEKLENFLGAAAPRAFGRSRRVRATFRGPETVS